MKNLKLIACLLSIVLFPLLVTGCESRNDSFQYLTVEDFQKVTIGMTPDQVKETLGGRSPEAAATMEGVPVGWGWVIWNEDDRTPGGGTSRHFKVMFNDGKVSEVEFSSGDMIEFTIEPDDAPAATGESAEGSSGNVEGDDEAKTTSSKGPKGVFYLPFRDKPFGGSVGDSIRVEELREIIAQADKEGPGQIVVLDIESGGGSVIEAIRICETIQEAKDRHTFVAWPGYSISAAAYISLACDRIVFKSTGRLGAITMHRRGQPVSDEEEWRWTTMLEHALEEAGQSPYWAKAMVKNAGFLSYVKDPVTGECEYFNEYQELPGEVILSTYEENCVVNWEEAIDSCLAYGKADSKEELAKVLDLPSWNELGTGQELYDDWHRTLTKCDLDLRKTKVELGRLGEFNRLTQIKKEIAIYRKWLRWWRDAPNYCFGKIPEKEDLERMIEELELERRNLARRP